ncbi:MAG: hypothetical protein WC816_07310 [Sphingomonas sp.]|jgi:hypothetical protein
MSRLLLHGLAALVLAGAPMASAAAPVPVSNDYPTETRVDYVIGCMAANGQTQDALRRCSCSIDVIASTLPFEAYEQAETVVRMRGESGESASLFRETPLLQTVVSRLREAQVEADFRCF